MRYWKLVDVADGWDTHKDKYEWIEEVEEKDRYGYKTGRKVEKPKSRKAEKPTDEYYYRCPWYDKNR